MTFPKLSRKIFRTRSVISMGLSAPDLSRFLQISLHSFHGHWKYFLTWLCRRQWRKKWSWEQWKPFSSWSGQSIHHFQSGIHWCLKKWIIWAGNRIFWNKLNQLIQRWWSNSKLNGGWLCGISLLSSNTIFSDNVGNPDVRRINAQESRPRRTFAKLDFLFCSFHLINF